MKFAHAILLSSLLGMVSAQAATISWSSAAYTVSSGAGYNLNEGQFDISGTKVLAENSGGGALSFDGIDFAVGSITMGSNYGSFHQESFPTPNTLLAADGTYGSAGVASTVNLTGLLTGESYRIQALIYDGRGGETGRTVAFDGINQGRHANGIPSVTWGNGLLVTGTFVADAPTQNFTIEVFKSGGASAGGQLNAITVFQIPEPSSALLAGLGALALLRRRR